MQRTRGFRLLLSVAVTLGLVLFVGCAALRRPRTAPLPGEEAHQKAVELLHALDQMAREGKVAEAVGGFDVLDGLRSSLTLAEKAGYDELRAEFQTATQSLKPLSEDEKVARAEEHFEAGLAAYEGKDYAAAARHLKLAASFNVSLGWWDNRKLSGVRGRVDATLADLRTRLGGAEQLCEEGRCEEAKAALDAIEKTGIAFGMADRVEELSGKVNKVLEEQAVQLLTKARGLVEQQQFEEAEAALAGLRPLAGRLNEEQRKEMDGLQAAVEKVTGVAIGIAPEQKAEEARKYYDLGLAAHKARDYAQAQDYLDKAAEMDVSLGFWANRKLRSVRSEVSTTLQQLRADLERGKQLADGGRLAEAQHVLQGVKDEGINIGQAQMEELANLLARTGEALAAKQQEQIEQARKEATALLERARTCAAQGDRDGAAAAVAELAPLAGSLSEDQQAEAARLRASVAGSADVTRVQAQMQKANQLTAEADKLLSVRRDALLKVLASDKAKGEGNLDAARTQLLDARRLLEGVDLTTSPAMGDIAREISDRLALVEGQTKERDRLAAVGQKLGGLMAEAQKLVASDLLAAEKKVLEAGDLAAREGATLTSELLHVKDAVLQAVEARYGPERRLRPEQYGRLVGLAEDYANSGEYAKANAILGLVKEAPADMVTADYRNQAVARMNVYDLEIARQEKDARQAEAVFEQCRADLQQQRPEAALARLQSVVNLTRESSLAADRRIEMLKRVVTMLDGELGKAVAEAFPDLRKSLDGQRAAAEVKLAGELSKFYVGSGSPELAAPYLEKLAAAGGQDAAWAKAQLGAVADQKGAAEKARLLDVADEAARVLQLAEKLNELARTGQMADAEAAQRQLADARVALQVKKAQAAIARGAYTDATALLADAPISQASPAVLAKLYEPVRQQLDSLKAAALRLKAADEALASYDVAAAHEQLAAVGQQGLEAGPLRLKLESLAGIVDATVGLQEGQNVLRAKEQSVRQAAQQLLAALQGRQEAWQRYSAALVAFLAGQEGGAAALQQVLAQPTGLTQAEVAAVRPAVQVLAAGKGQPAAPDLQQALGAAAQAFDAGDYIAAADRLARLRAMPGYEADEQVGRQAAALAAQVQQKEGQAERLYAEAVQAYRAGDTEAVTALTKELQQYRNTRAYQTRR